MDGADVDGGAIELGGAIFVCDGGGISGGGIVDPIDVDPIGPDGLNIGTVGTCSLL